MMALSLGPSHRAARWAVYTCDARVKAIGREVGMEYVL